MSNLIPTAIRPAAEIDRELLRRFFAGLSRDTAHARFFGGGFHTTDAMLDVLLGVRLPGNAFVALRDGEIIGHVLWTPLRGRSGAVDLGIVVADAWQGHGVGSALLAVTVADAQASGMARLEFSVLAENRKVNRFVRRRWARSVWAFVDGIVDYDIALSVPTLCSAA